MVSRGMDSSPFLSGYESYKRTNTLTKTLGDNMKTMDILFFKKIIYFPLHWVSVAAWLLLWRAWGHSAGFSVAEHKL